MKQTRLQTADELADIMISAIVNSESEGKPMECNPKACVRRLLAPLTTRFALGALLVLTLKNRCIRNAPCCQCFVLCRVGCSRCAIR